MPSILSIALAISCLGLYFIYIRPRVRTWRRTFWKKEFDTAFNYITSMRKDEQNQKSLPETLQRRNESILKLYRQRTSKAARKLRRLN